MVEGELKFIVVDVEVNEQCNSLRSVICWSTLPHKGIP